MIRQALRAKALHRQQISSVKSYGAPTRGWNARDGLANMKLGDAVRLRNWYPTTGDCVMRGGMEDHATGITGGTKSLHIYNAQNGTNKQFAASDSGVFDASSAGAAGASVATSTNGLWRSLNMGDGTSQWLLMFNGTDKPNYFNGTTWTAVDAASSPALIGLTTTNIRDAFEHQGRLYVIQKNSLSFWFLPALAVGGTLSEFDLSAFANKGGFLVSGGTWSRDAGDGSADLAVFVTSEGQVLVYNGTNPGSAAAWALIGVYDLPKPIGGKPITKLGGDLIIITQMGSFPLSKVLTAQPDELTDTRLAITNRIDGAFTVAARNFGSLNGWEGAVYPAQSALLFNIPTAESVSAIQYVMNTITKAWCEFEGWNATCFSVFNGNLYFGTGTEVKKAWTGTSDDGANIIADGKESFSKHGTDSQKELVLYRPILQTNGPIAYLTGCDVDFRDTAIAGEATFTVFSGAQWDVDKWDQGFWAAGLDIVRQWSSPRDNFGTWFAGKLKISTNALEVHWVSSDCMFNPGEGI